MYEYTSDPDWLDQDQNLAFIDFAVKFEVGERENDHLYSVSASKTWSGLAEFDDFSKHYVFKNVHFLKILRKRYTGGRFSMLKPL